MRINHSILAGLAALVLAACGGGNGGDSAALPTEQAAEFVPLAASESTTVFAGWLHQMSAQSLDGKESMNTSTFTPAVQDDAEPVAAPR